jgi:hypothetical protein
MQVVRMQDGRVAAWQTGRVQDEYAPYKQPFREETVQISLLPWLHLCFVHSTTTKICYCGTMASEHPLALGSLA